jgi:hypothetical protein
MRVLIALGLLALPLVAAAQVTPCKVLDPELTESYKGGCQDGLADDYGEASGAAQYKGGFKAGRKHGKGVKTWPSGDRYEGDFVEDRKEGVGTYTWGRHSAWAGEKYSGDYRNDRRHGFGTYEWPGGDRYSGPWENDVITGRATPGMIARSRAYAERVAAVGKRGTRACREFTVGLVTRDRVRGTVTAVEADRIGVRIDDAGRFEHTIGNTSIIKGTIIWDSLSAWVPC